MRTCPTRHETFQSKQDLTSCRRLRGGAGRTRTNHQSVMEHGWCPTNSPGRTPIHIAGTFAVLLDLPGFLILDHPPECYGTWFESDQLPWSDTLEPTTKVLWNMGVSDQPTSSDTRARAQKSYTSWRTPQATRPPSHRPQLCKPRSACVNMKARVRRV